MKRVNPSTSLAEQAYQIIKEAIINGELKDKETIPEEKVAKLIGISRTPVRDALYKLALEGLIVQRKNAPAIVASFSREKSLEYMEIRLLLEIANIEKVYKLLTPAIVLELHHNLEQQQSTLSEGSFADFLELDRQFHLILASRNPNEEMRRLIHQINTGVNRAFILLSNTVEQSADMAYGEHLQIVSAIEEQDFKKIEKVMRLHMNNVRNRFLQFGAQYLDE